MFLKVFKEFFVKFHMFFKRKDVNRYDKQLKKIEKTYKSWKELSSILEDEGGIWNEEKGEG